MTSTSPIFVRKDFNRFLLLDYLFTQFITFSGELQSMQEITSGQLAAARELAGKLELEKFELIKARNAKYLSYEIALCDSRIKLELSNAKVRKNPEICHKM